MADEEIEAGESPSSGRLVDRDASPGRVVG
jgi:hypothetical protein